MAQQLGWVDTNVFVVLLFPHDPAYPRARYLLSAIEENVAEAWIDPTVTHELTYVLKRTGHFPDREAMHTYIRSILLLEGIRAHDKEGLLDAVARWGLHEVGFVDTWLTVRALREEMPICSVNERDFLGIENTFRVAPE